MRNILFFSSIIFTISSSCFAAEVSKLNENPAFKIEERKVEVPEELKTRHSMMHIITDMETGCEYIVFMAGQLENNVTGGGMTPRLDTDGKPICRNANP